jgi:hypothetical protein
MAYLRIFLKSVGTIISYINISFFWFSGAVRDVIAITDQLDNNLGCRFEDMFDSEHSKHETAMSSFRSPLGPLCKMAIVLPSRRYSHSGCHIDGGKERNVLPGWREYRSAEEKWRRLDYKIANRAC